MQSVSIRRRLLAWYDKHYRQLPWRDLDPPNPYATLVSEAMLQQTQVATVLPYYLRFMKRFRTVQALAAASIDEVLGQWAGLGYYRRCHNLHAAARQIVDQFGGAFPRDVDGLRSLPGVGRYTAGAIASIAFAISTPAVDGNVRRVVSRVLGLGDANGSATLERVWSAVADWVPRRRPGDFNQALMELGARVCTLRKPDCRSCPLRSCCLHTGGRGVQPVLRGTGVRPVIDRVESRPAMRRAAKTLDLVTVAIELRGRLLFRRRPDEGLWGGLWEWPTAPVEVGASPQRMARRIVRQVSRSETAPTAPFHQLMHVLTHRRIRFHAYHVVLRGAPRRRADQRWLRLGAESESPMSRAQTKLLEALRKYLTAEGAKCAENILNSEY